MNKNEFSFMVGMALERIVRRLSDDDLEVLDDDFKLIELTLVHYIQLKYDGVEDNG